jgi:hypothetical protein
MQKTPKVPKIHYNRIEIKNPPKKPLQLPQEKISSPSKNSGDLKKMKIPRNFPKLQVIQPYPTSKTWN